MRPGLKALLDSRRAAEAEAAEATAQLDDDETRDAEEIERTKEAWLTAGSRIQVVLQAGCNLHAPKPGHWPVECRVYEETAAELCALERNGDFVAIMRAAAKALRKYKLRRPLTPEDFGASYGASVIGAVVGFNPDGTMEGCIMFQKRVRFLQELGWNYGSSTEMHCGLDKTLGARCCVVCPLALVEGVNADMCEGGAFEGQIIATGPKYVFQCPPKGVPKTNLVIWAPAVLNYVLADKDHDLHDYAQKGIAPPLTTPEAREERGKATKEGMANISPAARTRMHDGQKKGYEKSGVGLPGKKHRSHSTEADVLAQIRGYAYFVFILEASACIQDKRKPTSWAADVLTPEVLKRVADAGLAQFEFWTVLPEEKKKGVQGFDMEKFIVTRVDGEKGTHVSHYQIETQRGPFPAYDVAVALTIFGENERPPKLPWGTPNSAPVAIKELIARALAWSPPASQPSPPPAKKPRSAAKGPRRSARLIK